MLMRRPLFATTKPQPTGRPTWLPRAAVVITLLTLTTVCGSDDSDDAPATTADATSSTTANPAEGPQPSLEPGSNLPPDDDPNEPASPNTDDTSETSTTEQSGG